MLLYPQLLSGAVAQYPLRISREMANAFNLQEDGTRYLEVTTNPSTLRWQLTYKHLQRQEIDALETFFEATRGPLLTFIFLDPTGNLLNCSEDLSQPFWERSPQLAVSQIIGDLSTSFELASTGGGVAVLSQIVPCPSKALLCFSLYARANQATQMTLAVWDTSNRTQKIFSVGADWKQYFVSQIGSGQDAEKTLEVSLNGASPIQVSRISLNAQPAPASYVKTSQRSGIKPQTRFDQDTLLVTALGDDAFSCSVVLTTRLD